MGFRSALLNSLPHTDRGNRLYWRLRFRRKHGRWPNGAAERFTDHLYRIKTDGRLGDPLYRRCTDKETAKDYIAERLGPGFTPETYAILRSDAEIDAFEPDPVPCVIKPTHASGEVIFHRDPAAVLHRDRLKAWLRLDYYRAGRELNYLGLRPKVIVEEFFSDGRGAVPRDYKVFCFFGSPKLVQCISGRGGSERTVENFYDTTWERLDCTLTYPQGDGEEAPPLLADLLDIAARLAAPFPFIRVDLYASATEIRIGELTPCPAAANDRLDPDSADIELGALFGGE